MPQVDRLITELKLPPADAYHKLRHTIEEVNSLLNMYMPGSDATEPYLDPIKGNVAFSSCVSGWSFTLESFAQLYCDVYGISMDARWGTVSANDVEFVDLHSKPHAFRQS